jgi:cytochrome oxidase assembly protein ShyY1
MLIDSREQAEALGRPVLRGYLQLTAVSPKPRGEQPQRIPEPDHSSIGPHMAYAVQWWLFAAAVPVGWVVLARRERRDRLAQERGEAGAPAEPASAAAATGPSTGTTAGSASAE